MTDTDKDLLERAARAAGFGIAWGGPDKDMARRVDDWSNWNPLTDDGDALRLALKLKMFLDLESCNAANSDDPVTLWFGGGDDEHAGVSHDECDPAAATRRAIVRAAASLGDAK